MRDNNDKSNINSALLEAAWLGELIVVRKLLEAGADVNSKSTDSLTALHLAAYRCHLRVVKVLIEEGADVNCQNKAGWTALHAAANMNIDYTEIVRVLIEAGADFRMKAKDGHTALYMASHGCHIAICNLLMDVGACEDEFGN